MAIKGVCYDVGRVYGGRFLTRPVFDPAATRRELQIIRDDLHCNAVRFQGRDITRLMTAVAGALGLGLEVWLSPEPFEKSREATLACPGPFGQPACDEPTCRGPAVRPLWQLQAFLAEASQRVRQVFHGPLTHASTPFEVVDWSLFDFIGVDHYGNSKVEDRYAETIRPYLGQGKPVVNSEFG